MSEQSLFHLVIAKEWVAHILVYYPVEVFHVRFFGRLEGDAFCLASVRKLYVKFGLDSVSECVHKKLGSLFSISCPISDMIKPHELLLSFLIMYATGKILLPRLGLVNRFTSRPNRNIMT